MSSKPPISDKCQQFADFLRRKNALVTRQRLTIASFVFGKGEEFNAEELFLEIRRHDKKVSRTAVYRTLHLLVECGVVAAQKTPKKVKYWLKR